VHPYHPKYKPTKDVPVVKGVTAYDDVESGKTYILCVNQGLYFRNEMKHSLLNQNQMRSNGVIVDDCLVHLSHNQSSTHSIYFQEEDIRIPLELHGCMSHFLTRLPSKQELDNCQWLELTDETEWEPYSDRFRNDEQEAIRKRSIMSMGRNRASEETKNNYESSELRAISRVYSLKDTVEHHVIAGMSSGVKLSITAQELSDTWGISMTAAQQTLRCTTQQFIRTKQQSNNYVIDV
jgi:hypothetical protein